MKGRKTPSFLVIYYHTFAFNARNKYNMIMENNEGAQVFVCGAENGTRLQVFITDTHLVLDAFDENGDHLKNITQTFEEWVKDMTPSPNPQVIEPVKDFL